MKTLKAVLVDLGAAFAAASVVFAIMFFGAHFVYWWTIGFRVVGP